MIIDTIYIILLNLILYILILYKFIILFKIYYKYSDLYDKLNDRKIKNLLRIWGF